MTVALQVNDVWTCNIGTYFNGQAGINTVRYRVLALAGAGASDQDLATDLDDVAAPLYKAAMHNSASYYGTKVFRKVPAPQFIPYIFAGNTGNGTGGATPMPTAVCGIVALLTSTYSKKGRGRLFIPFPSTSFVTAGEPSGGYVAILNSLGSGLLNLTTVGIGGNNATVQLVVTGKALTAPTPFVSTTIARGKWGTQHRRGDYGRLNPNPPFAV